ASPGNPSFRRPDSTTHLTVTALSASAVVLTVAVRLSSSGACVTGEVIESLSVIRSRTTAAGTDTRGAPGRIRNEAAGKDALSTGSTRRPPPGGDRPSRSIA